ncbi:MAG: tRNA uridine-5-carboxymethylaminomethyl(34) synthesis GTPase MnmE [Caldisericia bacterium]|nr:tRNA uridine-5-carboxymethylaminomethyl(34) synthesis GTPase MnmE [Caldisericia bacterium]
MSDQIVAIATPPGESALSAIRLSGDDCISLVQSLTTSSIGEHQKAKRVLLKDPISGVLLDDVVVICYRESSSYTGEEMVEIFCHGGNITVHNVFNSLVKAGARPAPPGEFSKRAVLNGKIDIIQAESIEQIVKARSSKEAELSLQTLKGSLSKVLSSILLQLEEILVEMDARLSFPNDVYEEDSLVFLRVKTLQSEIQSLINASSYSSIINKGFSVVLMGKTNVGKSTLFNVLVGFERTVVSPYPSTTHDYVSEIVSWEGYPITIFDTAGVITINPSPLDEIFNNRMESLYDSAFMLLYVIDAMDCSQEDLKMISSNKRPNMVIVVNKTDLSKEDPKWLSNLPDDSRIVKVSAINKTGIDPLVTSIIDGIKKVIGQEPDYYVNQRQSSILVNINNVLDRITCSSEPFMDMAVEDIKEAIFIMKEELNVSHSKELLNDIFSHFCIGK